MIGGVILAAGASTRMGRFKPLLPVGDSRFIDIVIDKMRRAGVGPIVVVTGYRKEELEAALADAGVAFIHNENYATTQMLDSVRLGIQRIEEISTESLREGGEAIEGILLSPADCVLSPVELYLEVIGASGDFVRPSFEGEPGHPVFIRRKLFDLISRYDGVGGLRGAVESSGVSIEEIEVSTPAFLKDADTPEDYELVLRYYDAAQSEWPLH